MSANRWWIYQRERFPIFAHAPLIAAFSFSAISYSSLLRGPAVLPGAAAAIVAFFSAFLSFLQLRLADEFKDFDEDSRYRPYRPVPRGLIKLRELGWVWVASGVLQLLMALLLKPQLAPLLLIVWIYLSMMSKEFFVKRWLKSHPFTYMWTHMLIMPVIDFYTTACDWMVVGVRPPKGLTWFLLVSFFNGMVVEIGRKIRSPQDEEKGVETYSFLWGRGGAVAAWLTAMLVTAAFAWLAADRIAFGRPVLWLLGVLLVAAVGLSLFFLRDPKPKRGKLFEAMAGVWSLLMYLSLGAVPLLLRYFGVHL
ncbi:MAG: UbiA family prenyltransferase [Candidatus Acidiferrales bacterium]